MISRLTDKGKNVVFVSFFGVWKAPPPPPRTFLLPMSVLDEATVYKISRVLLASVNFPFVIGGVVVLLQSIV